MDALLLALLAAMTAMGARRAARAWQHWNRARERGSSAARPLAVNSFDAVDVAVGRARCSCGAHPRRTGEHRHGTSMVVTLSCPRCGAESALHLDLSGLLQ